MVHKHTISLEDEAYDTAMIMYKRKNFSGVSDLINRALEEYLAREAGQTPLKLLSKEAVSVIENAILLSERRINRFLFKIAVSDTEMKHVLVNGYKRIEPDFLDKVRDKSEREVRLKNGILDLRTVVEEVQEGRERISFEE